MELDDGETFAVVLHLVNNTSANAICLGYDKYNPVDSRTTGFLAAGNSFSPDSGTNWEGLDVHYNLALKAVTQKLSASLTGNTDDGGNSPEGGCWP